MRPVARAGRWAWGLCGLATAAALAIPGTFIIVSAGTSPPSSSAGASRHARVRTARVLTRTVTVPQPVSSLTVRGYAGLIAVTAARVTHVQVTETIAYYDRPPAVVQSVAGGRLTLADPACAKWTCSVSFAVTVPLGVPVTAVGGPVFISGTAAANLDSRGTPVSAADIHGPLTVSTDGGPLQISGLTGPLRADTDGGQVVATRLTAATAVVATGTGPAQIAFSAAPESVSVSTAGGSVTLTVPGGPYALTANSDSAPQLIGVATSSAALRSITVTTGGGPLLISSRARPGNELALPQSASTAWLPLAALIAPRLAHEAQRVHLASGAGLWRQVLVGSRVAGTASTMGSQRAVSNSAREQRIGQRQRPVGAVLGWLQSWLQVTRGQ